MAFAADATPAFTKDVAPIFQEKCEACHRPDSIAPMSLRTYEETRPWARSIRNRVVARQMPPWHIDKTVGIQQYKNDRSLTDDQIDTIVRWVDGGAPRGDLQDMPPAREWVGYGDRTVDEMAHAWVNVTYMSDQDFQAEVEARNARLQRNTQQQ